MGKAFNPAVHPRPGELDVVEVFDDHPQRKAVETVGAGQVLVMDCRQDPSAASGGYNLMTRLLRRGVAGVVTDASMRGSHPIARMPFAAFVAGVSPQLNLAKHHAVDMQVPIGCAGVPVYPGDIMVGDEEGVVCIPRHLAAEIAKPAANQELLETFIFEGADEGARLAGTYPPDDDTRAAFEKWLETR